MLSQWLEKTLNNVKLKKARIMKEKQVLWRILKRNKILNEISFLEFNGVPKLSKPMKETMKIKLGH